MAECPNARSLGCFVLHVFDLVSLDVMRDTIEAIQLFYVKHPEFLHGFVGCDLPSQDWVVIKHVGHRTPDKYLQAVLSVDLNHERKPTRLGAEVGWVRLIDGVREMDATALWRELRDVNTGKRLQQYIGTNGIS
jgi:hypothetical protein